MFDQIKQVIDSKEQCHAELNCFDVRYLIYFECNGRDTSIYSYVVHPVRGGLIRRDRVDYCVDRLNFGGPLSIVYGKEQ